MQEFLVKSQSILLHVRANVTHKLQCDSLWHSVALCALYRSFLEKLRSYNSHGRCPIGLFYCPR